MSMYEKATRFNTSKDKVVQDTRITNCTDCERGIFPQHDKTWTRRGFVHTECNNEFEKFTPTLSDHQ